jgi:hypothetical protein
MRTPHFFKTFEIFSVSVFTIEYILKVWTANLHPEYQNSVTGRLLYMVSPMALIDLMAVAPFYLPMVMSIDLRFLRILRLFHSERFPESCSASDRRCHHEDIETEGEDRYSIIFTLTTKVWRRPPRS